jgi:molecular chaperone DnaJ
VHINVWTPQKISSDEKKFFEKVQSSKNVQPDPSKNEKSFFDRVKEMFG